MQRAGFTVVEILVAVTLLAMLGLIVSSSMSSILGAMGDTRRTQDHYHTARVALSRLEREVAMAYVSKHQGERQTTRTAFLGKGNALTFTYMGHRRMVADARETDEGVVEYKLERERDDNVLVRREKTVIDDRPYKGGQRLVLARGVKSLKFQYWDLDKEAWQSDWKVEIDNVQMEQQQKAAAATTAAMATGSAALGKALVNQKQAQPKHGPDDHWLPARVRILMVLDTEEGELAFETQTKIHLMEPLDFNGVTVASPFNPGSPLSGVVPPPGAMVPGVGGGVGGAGLGASPAGGR